MSDTQVIDITPVQVTPPTQVEEKPIPKILIGVPILAWTHEFALSYLNFWTDLMCQSGKGRKFEVGYKFAYRRPVHMAEEELAQFAIDTGCTHVLLMDDDIYDVTAKDLFALLDADKDVVGGIMHTSKFPYAICAFRRYNLKTRVIQQPILNGPARLYEVPPDQQVGVQPCDLIPFGFTLIKTSVFNKIKKPWFQCNTQAPTDSFFMDSIMDSGIKPYAHFDVWLNHNGITRQTKPFMFNMEMEKQKSQPGKVIGVTPSEMQKHMLIMDLKMKDAERERVILESKGHVFNTIEGD